MAKHRRIDVFGGSVVSSGGDIEYESLKQAYLLAVERDTPEEVCNELHRKIMAARPSAQQQAFNNSGGLEGLGGLTGAGGLGGLTSALATYQQPQSLLAQEQLLGQSSGLNNAASGMVPTTGMVGIEDRDSARLFVGGLPYECTAEELRALVEQLQFSLDPALCQLLECRVLPSRGCGYVRFSSWDAAHECIQALDGRSVTGWQLPLRVRWATPKSTLQSQGLAGCGGGALPQQGGGADGGINAVSAALQALLGGDAAKAVAQLSGGAFQENVGAIASEEASIVNQGLDPTRLFVGQLTRELSDQSFLQAPFEQFGAIEGIRWLQDKGVAYIKYTDFNGARAAVAALDKKHVQGVSTQQGLNVQFSKVR